MHRLANFLHSHCEKNQQRFLTVSYRKMIEKVSFLKRRDDEYHLFTPNFAKEFFNSAIERMKG
jgi:hypothetical protein